MTDLGLFLSFDICCNKVAVCRKTIYFANEAYVS